MRQVSILIYVCSNVSTFDAYQKGQITRGFSKNPTILNQLKPSKKKFKKKMQLGPSLGTFKFWRKNRVEILMLVLTRKFISPLKYFFFRKLIKRLRYIFFD